jgi:transcriptional regulator with XRE-family HTH domain
MNINIFENSETISKRIKNIRKYYKMNQQDFAKEIGILQSTLSEIERGNVSPQFKTLQLLGDMIGRSNLEWLLYGKTETIKTDEWNKTRINNLLIKLNENELKFCREWLELYVNSLKKK